MQGNERQVQLLMQVWPPQHCKIVERPISKVVLDTITVVEELKKEGGPEKHAEPSSLFLAVEARVMS